MPLNREISTDVYLGTFKQSSSQGEKRERVLSLVDKLYRDKMISAEAWMAFGTLRNLFFMEAPPSEGISSYGLSVKASEPSTKADRWGRRYTGFEITPDDELHYVGGRKSMRNKYDLADAIFAAVGVHDQSNRKRIHRRHVDILERITCDTESMPTLAEIAHDLGGPYRGAKQIPPFAVGWIVSLGERLALHFRVTRMG